MSKGKHKTSYPLAIFLNTMSLLILLGGIACAVWLVYLSSKDTQYVKESEGFFDKEILGYIIGGAGLVQFIVLRFPLKKMLGKAILDNEYDEFGRSKKKSFENLTRREREEIDRQKAAQMEQLLSSSVIKKITKKGSEKPEEDLQGLIGLYEVKQKVNEMVARMKFEKDTGKANKSQYGMNGRHFCFYGSAGTGKAQPLYSKVLTPNGFIPMKDVFVGTKVIDGNGNEATVMGVFPQGEKDIYEIIFDDGSTCRCSKNHLWVAQTDRDRQKGTYRTVELSEIMNTLKISHGDVERNNWSIDYVAPVEFSEKDFYIHPYLLGLLIGDGCLQNDSISISLYDEELREKINDFFPEGNYRLTRKSTDKKIHDYSIVCDDKKFFHTSRYANLKPLNYHLMKLGLKGKHSDEKFIPVEYLYSSREQRLWLLRGLLDTDGTVGKNGSYIEYTTTSAQLKTDIAELVHSLGGYVSITERVGAYKKGEEKRITKKNYRLIIQFSKENADVFCLKRKAEKYNPRRSQKSIKRIITDVKYVGKEECQCIYIDSPCHTYITDNYIVTHNTTVARIIAGFLYKNGYIKQNKVIEINGGFLKEGEYSEEKTKLVIQQAYGGVLFIDEAYSIIEGNSNYGKAVVAELIKEMEDNRDKFTVILAGYKNDMKRLVDANEGFKSRIKEYLEFPDYSVPEMMQIFENMAHSAGFVVSEGAMSKFEQRISNEKALDSFGNGRTVRNVLDECIDKHALNYGQEIIGKEEKFILCDCDINVAPNRKVL